MSSNTWELLARSRARKIAQLELQVKVLKDSLSQVATDIAMQGSCASSPGECYLDHNGCFVADSLRIARAAADVVGR